MIYKFRNDYSELVHPRILEAIGKYASEQNVPYGLDYHSENAAKYIKDYNIIRVHDVSLHYPLKFL